MNEDLWNWIAAGWVGILTLLFLFILIKSEIDFNDHNRH